MGKKINFPTSLTILRMILAVVFFVLMLCGLNTNGTSGQTALYLSALICFLVAAVTDKIDGDYARKHNQVTDLGKFLDPLADKMLVDMAFLTLVVIGAVPAWVFAVILWRDLAVDGMRMLLAQERVVLAASMWGKVKTAVQMAALIVTMLNLIAQNSILELFSNTLLDIAVTLTVISGIEILVKGFKKLNKNSN